MFNSVALNIVIGLVFIYLLYSLFATVLAEIIATKVALRARNLKEAVNRMLNDEEEDERGRRWWLVRFFDSFNFLKNPANPVVQNFYNHPEIKYLGSSGIFKTPSSFKSISFSKTLIYLLNESVQEKGKPVDIRIDKDRIEAALNHADNRVLGKETYKYVYSLWLESAGDIVKFRLLLEGWFDRTMEQALEWYKRKIQVILLVIGFLLAVFFNADTFVIVKKLSRDKDARDQMVKMASSYIESHKSLPVVIPAGRDSSLQDSILNKRLDSLLEIRKELQDDITDANTILGLGGWLPDTVRITDTAKGVVKYDFPIEPEYAANLKRAGEKLGFGFGDKCRYLGYLAGRHIWGFLVTAIAISLGAPFWFDLLNKLMKLRTSTKQETDTPEASQQRSIASLNREL